MNKYLKKFLIGVAIVVLLDILVVLIALFTDNILLVVLTFIPFVGLLVYSFLQIYLPYRNGLEEADAQIIPNMDTAEVTSNSFKLISTKPLLANLVIPDNTYLFDQDYIYQMGASGVVKIRISDIVEIGRTGTKLSNRSIWFVKSNHEGAMITFRFAHNYTLWNHNFTDFLDLVRRVNPNAKIKNFSIWTM